MRHNAPKISTKNVVLFHLYSWIKDSILFIFFIYVEQQNKPHILDAWDQFINRASGGTVDCRNEENTGIVLDDSISKNISSSPYTDEHHYATVAPLNQSDLTPFVLSDVFFGVASIFSFLNLFRELVGNFFVGPLRVSLGGMIGDIIRFTIIFIFVWISFAMGLRQIYQSYNVVTTIHCLNPEGCERTPFEG